VTSATTETDSVCFRST